MQRWMRPLGLRIRRDPLVAALLVAAAAMVGMVLALAMPAGPAAANDPPIRVALSYLIGVSTWGPRNATGIVEIIPEDGEVRLTAAGLPELSGEQYRLWIVNQTTGDRLSLGAFIAEPGGIARLDLVRPPFADKGWDVMLVSVEADANETPEPSARRSIAGRVPAPRRAEARAGQLPSTAAQVVPTSASAPAEPAGRDWPPFTALALLAAGLLGFGLGRLTGRRAHRGKAAP